MKTQTKAIIMGLLIFISFGCAAAAENGQQSFAVTLGAGYYQASDSKITQSWLAGAKIYCRLLWRIGLEASCAYMNGQSEGVAGELSRGTFKSLPIGLQINTHFLGYKSFAPYAVIGASFFLNQFTVDDSVNDIWQDLNYTISEKINNKIGYKAGLGLDIKLSRHLLVNIEGMYHLLKLKSEYTLTGPTGQIQGFGVIENIDLNPVMIFAGLKYCL